MKDETDWSTELEEEQLGVRVAGLIAERMVELELDDSSAAAACWPHLYAPLGVDPADDDRRARRGKAVVWSLRHGQHPTRAQFAGLRRGLGLQLLQLRPTRSPGYSVVAALYDKKLTWRRLNILLREALSLAVRGGLRFDLGDLARMMSELGGRHWLSGPAERLYGFACEAKNTSACQTFEQWFGRPPFIHRGKRLHVGAPAPIEGRAFEVTSLSAEGIICCAYTPGPAHPRRPDRKVTLTRAQVRALGKEEPDHGT